MTQPRRSPIILAIDDDPGFLFGLSQALAGNEIALVPAVSVEKARSTLAELGAVPEMLILNCRIAGVCAFAIEMLQQNSRRSRFWGPNLSNIGACIKIVASFFNEPDDKRPDGIRKWMDLITTLLTGDSGHS